MEDLIREIMDDDDIKTSVALISESFGTVAREFGLTKENCPTHPSFVTLDQLKELHRKGLQFFGLFLGGEQVGFVAAERGNEDKYYMEKLAVLPRYRHYGYGARLVRFALDHASARGAEILSIGIIDKHTTLKNWYKGFGFLETETKKFSHLPFTVCFMEIALSGRKTAFTLNSQREACND